MSGSDVRSGLVIHLGNKKTGSTSLQGFLSANEDALRDKGVNFLRTGRKHISHNRLFRPLRGDDAADVWAEVEAEVDADPERLHLMSSEMFFDESVARGMAEHMSPTLRERTRLVVYLRRQDAYLEAMYKQLTKNGRLDETPKDFVRMLGTELGGYEVVMSIFERAVGREAITLRVFERSRLRDGDTTEDFLHQIGLTTSAPDFVKPPHVANETLSRAATRLLGALTRNSRMNAREIAREMLRGDDAPPRRSGDVFRIGDRRRIMERFEEENARLAAAYLGGDAPLFGMDDLAKGVKDPYPTPTEELRLHDEAQVKTAAAIGRIDGTERGRLFRG